MDPGTAMVLCDRCGGPRCECGPPDPPKWPDVYAYEVQADGTRVRLEAPSASALLDLIREYDRRG